MLWVLRNIPQRYLIEWWSADDSLTDFIQLLELCIAAFPYVGIRVREADTQFDSILSPESINSFVDSNTTTGGTVMDYKSHIETMMSSLHMKSAGASFRGRMAMAAPLVRSRTGTLGNTNTASGRSTLRQARATMAARRTGTLKKGNMNTLTSSSREYLLKLVRWEAALSHMVSQTVLATLATFLNSREESLRQTKDEDTGQPCDLVLGSLSLLVALLTSNQSNNFLLSLYPTLRLFISRFGQVLFHSKPVHKLVEKLAADVFKHCTYYSPDVRLHALSITFLLLRANFSRERKLAELEITLTVTLSRMVADLASRGEKAMKQCLIALPLIAQRCSTFSPDDKAAFLTCLETLLTRLNTILADSMEITRQQKMGDDADSTIIEHLLIQIADAFSHMPETRVTWLNRLAEHHKRMENYAEAGQCYLAIATLCRERRVVFGLSGLEHDENEENDDDKVIKSVALHLDLACRMLDKGELFEQCYDVYKQLFPIHEQKRDYRRLSSTHHHVHEVMDKLIEANKKQSRMLGTYYRVGFYGRKFGPRLDGNEFIYKMPKITRLSEITTKLKTLYAKQLGCKVTVLPDSGPVDRAKLDPEEATLQITFVSPHFSADDGKKRSMFIDKNTNLLSFTFSTPFTKTGAAFGSVTEQYKRNTVVSVRNPFPHVTTAQQIVKREESILDPIQSACEDVDERTRRMSSLLDSGQVDPKALSALLAGSVATQVHGGAKEVCLAFLQQAADPEEGETKEEQAASPFSQEEQDKLRKSMRDFVQACRRGLAVNEKLVQSESERAFQTVLDKQFEELCLVINPLIKERKKKLHRKGVRFGAF